MKYIFICFIAFSSCIQYTLKISKVSPTTIKGSVAGYSSGSSLSQKINSSDESALSCVSPKAILYKIDEDGNRMLPEVASTAIASDGSYSFSNLKVEKLSERSKIPKEPMIVQVSGCGGVYLRPITGFSDQNVTMGSTVLSYLLNTPSRSRLASALQNNFDQLNTLMNRLSTATSLSEAYTLFSTSAQITDEFNKLFGLTPSSLKEAFPEIVSVNISQNASEMVSSRYSVVATHFLKTYKIAFDWRLDGIKIGSAAEIDFTPSANQQGVHQLKLTVGEDDGTGFVNLNLPTKTYTSNLKIGNNVLAVAPRIRLQSPSAVGTNPINTRSISLSIDTGPNKENCASFSSLALTENSSEVPSSAAFTINCSQANTQTFTYQLASSGDGLKTIRLWAMDSEGNKSATATATAVNVYLDTIQPTVQIASGPDTITNSAQQIIHFVADDSGGKIDHFECQLDASIFSACASPIVYTGLSEGSHTFNVKVVDTAGNISLTATRNWTIDLTPPTLTLNSQPNSITNQTSSSFAFSASDLGGGAISSYFCRVDAAEFSVCSSPYLIVLSAGSHVFSVKAKDAAGNVSLIQNSNWIIDLTAPTVSLTSKPASLNNSTSAAFTFVGADSGGGTVALYQCQVDGGGYSGCVSPKSYSGLSASSHTFDVRAVDTAGNVSSVTHFVWTVDLTTPLASINSGPVEITNSTTASFTFSANAPPGGSILGYECNLDNSGWVSSCVSPKSYSGLASGGHSFSVRSVDNNSNRSSASTYSWTVDTISPSLVISASPNSVTNLASANFSFSATDSGGGSVSSFNCKLDSGSFSTCSSPMLYSSLTEGAHTFSIRVNDTAGNTSSVQTVSWVVDLTPPTLLISVTPSSITKLSTAQFSFSATDTGGGSVSSYKCSVDGQAYTACTSPKTYSSLSEGSHQFSVVAFDTAGNTSLASSYTWVIDQTSPTVNITSSPSSLNNLTTASFSFSASDTGGGTVSSYSCKLDSSSYVSCTSPVNYSSLAAGSHTFYITATDSAGNTSSELTLSWTTDLTPPTVVISSPSANGSVILVSQLSNFSLSGQCSESDKVVTLTGAINQTATCSAGAWSTTLDLSGVADGVISLTASQTDAAGNTTTTPVRTVIKDTTLPLIAVNTPASLQGHASSSSVSWSLTELNVATNTNFQVELYDGANWSNIGTVAATAGANSGQLYTLSNFSTPLIDTTHAKIRVSLTDAAGQATTAATNEFIIDSTPPVLASVSINNGAAYAGSSIVNVQVDVNDALSGSAMFVKLAAGTGAGECQSQFVNSGWTAWASSSQNIPFTISPVDGVKKICVWAKDAVGNITVMSPTIGVAGVNYSTIIRQASSPPQVTALTVYNTLNTTSAYALNNPVTINWSAVGAGGLDNNPIALSYSTNGTTWYDVVTKADSSIAANQTWLGGLSGNPTSVSGSYTSFTAPSASYFIIKAVVRDVAGNMSVVVMSQPQNTGNWSVFAGSTDRGDNGSGLSATLYGDGGGGRPFAINPLTNDLYTMDDGYGIRKLDIQTGLVTTYIPTGTLNLPANGTLSSSSRVTVGSASSMLIDSNGIMYYSSYFSNSAAKIYKINLANNHVEFYAGGGTANTTSATPSTIYVSYGAMDLDANKNLYFLTSCDTTSPTYLTPKKLMMLSQNIDGTAGALTEIAGSTCALGAPVAGQPASTQPLTAGTAYPTLSSIAAINPNFVYFSSYGNSPIKIVNGTIYSANVGANSSVGVLTYNRSTNKIYRSVSGLSFGYFTPVNTGNGGETFTTVATSNGTGDCVSDGVLATSACVTVDSGFSFDSNGLVYFLDGYRNNAPSGYRVRYVDANNQIRTILGSLPFYGDGLNKGLIRGTIGGIYYKKSTELNQAAFSAGLYLVSPYVVFGRINEGDQVYHTLWGNQQGNNYAAPTGTVVSSSVSMGVPYAGGNGKALSFDSNGLPWLRASNQLVQIDTNNKVVVKASASGNWWETGAAPSTASMWVFGGYQNLALKGADGAFLIGGYQNLQTSNNTNPQIRFLDFTNALNTKVMGGSYLATQTTAMSVDITTPGGVQAAPLYYNCVNSAACSIQYIESQDRLYFINTGDRYIRYITNPTNPAASLLTTMPTQLPNSFIINFIFKEDLSQVFLLDSRGGLYCMDISSGKGWCDNSTNLYPYASTMGSFSYGPNQMTWKDSTTLLISNYKGQVLQYNLLP